MRKGLVVLDEEEITERQGKKEKQKELPKKKTNQRCQGRAGSETSWCSIWQSPVVQASAAGTFSLSSLSVGRLGNFSGPHLAPRWTGGCGCGDLFWTQVREMRRVRVRWTLRGPFDFSCPAKSGVVKDFEDLRKNWKRRQMESLREHSSVAQPVSSQRTLRQRRRRMRVRGSEKQRMQTSGLTCIVHVRNGAIALLPVVKIHKRTLVLRHHKHALRYVNSKHESLRGRNPQGKKKEANWPQRQTRKTAPPAPRWSASLRCSQPTQGIDHMACWDLHVCVCGEKAISKTKIKCWGKHGKWLRSNSPSNSLLESDRHTTTSQSSDDRGMRGVTSKHKNEKEISGTWSMTHTKKVQTNLTPTPWQPPSHPATLFIVTSRTLPASDPRGPVSPLIVKKYLYVVDIFDKPSKTFKEKKKKKSHDWQLFCFLHLKRVRIFLPSIWVCEVAEAWLAALLGEWSVIVGGFIAAKEQWRMKDKVRLAIVFCWRSSKRKK